MAVPNGCQLLKEKAKCNTTLPPELASPDYKKLQNHVDHLLRRGILFSLLWLAGFGSLYAFINGLRARKLIKQSNGFLKGNGKVWWCLIMGAFGILVWSPIYIIGIYNNL
jgi:hypothetical protein